jgi:hypothetical protein
MSKVKQQFIKGAGVAVAVALTGASMQASALTINFTAAAGMSAAAITGFMDAGAIWETKFTGYRRQRGHRFHHARRGILGSAGSGSVGKSFVDVKTKMAADATSADDASSVASHWVPQWGSG